MLTKRSCEHCGGLFFASRISHRFCSTSCRVAANRKLKKDTPEVQEAKISLYQHYKAELEKLSEKELAAALADIWTNGPKTRLARENKESLLVSLTKGR